MTSSLGYGAIIDGWRSACPDQWAAYVGHAFVRGLQDGTLPRGAYLGYLRQDYLFLGHFARAWGLAAAKAADLSELRQCASILDSLVNTEIALHVETCKGAGISEADLQATREEAENLAYTRFVLATGYGGDFLDLMAALAPCVIGYGEIGATLARANSASAYQDWITVYGGESYQSDCQNFGHMLERAVERRLGPTYHALPRWRALCEIFAAATRLEAGFWDMGLRVR